MDQQLQRGEAPSGPATPEGEVSGGPASEPEPTGIDKILVEQFGYEFVNGKAYAPGTAPKTEAEGGEVHEIFQSSKTTK